jgi:hypothetical protein
LPSTINASNSGFGGIVSTGDSSGELQLQTAGTTAVTIDTSQRAAFVAGTAAAPAITTAGDTNTGIFFPAADTTAFAEGGVEAMRIDSSGNVGIGTTAPNTFPGKLAVIGDGIITDYDMISRVSSGNANADRGFKQITDGSGEFSIYSPNGGGCVFGIGSSYTERMRIDSAGALILVGSTAQKATGTTWSNPSDQRLKDNIRDYTKGTTELMQVRVREWEYNGKGGTTEGLKGLGVVADEVMTILPNTVETYNAKLNADDEEDTEIKKFDATEITWLLVKTVQEQQTIINNLKARIETLEAK